MVFGILAPTAEEWLIFQRMTQGEHLYVEGVEEGEEIRNIPFVWRGHLTTDRNVRGTYLTGRQLNSMTGGHWIVYDSALGECTLTHEGRETLRLYRPSARSNRVVRKKRNE
jgi:hypothetical protein